jgi:ADP-ribose pyrophosphatase
MSEMPDVWKSKSSKQIADCRVFKVRQDFCERERDGKESDFFVIEAPNWINIIALTKDEEVVLIEQFRHGTEEITLEIPSGMIDDGEEPIATARRELLEETGFSSENIVLIGKSNPNPAIQNNEMFHYLAVDCEKNGETNFDEHESIITKMFPLGEIDKLIENGKFAHSLAVAAFQYFSIYRGKKE